MPWLFGAAALTIGYGVIAGLAIAPPDYQQGEAFRMIYVHVPAAILSVTIYTLMAAASAVALIWRIKVGHAVAAASAPVGASITLMTLVTGILVGQAHVGHLLGLGPAVDLGTDFAVPVLRRHVVAFGL